MKGTPAVLGSCFMILAVVDAISIGKMSVSNINVDWVKTDPDPPNDTPWYVVKDLDQYSPGRPFTGILPHSYVGDELYLHGSPRKPEADSWQTSASQEYDVDNRQRKSFNDDPLLTLKMKMKIRLPQADRAEEAKVSNPYYETAIDKELYPDEYSLLYPTADSYDQASKNVPEPVNYEWLKNVEVLQHSSRFPNYNEELASKPTRVNFQHQLWPIHNEATAETTQLYDYFNHFDPYRIASDAVSDDRSAVLYNNIHGSETSQLPVFSTQQLTAPQNRFETGSKNSRNEPQNRMKLSDRDYFESKPSHEASIAKLYDEIYKISNTPHILNDHVLTPILLSQNTVKDNVNISDTVDSVAELAKVQDKDKKYYYDTSSSLDRPQLQFANSRTSLFSVEEPELEPYILGNKSRSPLYEILRGITPQSTLGDHESPRFQHSMPVGQIEASDLVDSKSESKKNFGGHTESYDGTSNFTETPRLHFVKRPSDSHSSDNEPTQDELHVKLYNDNHKASKPIHLVGDSHTTTLSHDTPNGHQIELSEREVSKNGPAKEDDPTELLHDSNQKTQTPEQYSANSTTVSHSITDSPEIIEIKPEIEPPSSDLINEEPSQDPEDPMAPWKLMDPTKAFPEPTSVGQVPMDKPEYEPTLSDPDGLEGSKKVDNEVKNEGRLSDLAKPTGGSLLTPEEAVSDRPIIKELKQEPKWRYPYEFESEPEEHKVQWKLSDSTKAFPTLPPLGQVPEDMSEYLPTLSDPNELGNSKKKDTEVSYEDRLSDRLDKKSPDSSWHSRQPPLSKTDEENDLYTSGRTSFLSKIISWLG